MKKLLMRRTKKCVEVRRQMIYFSHFPFPFSDHRLQGVVRFVFVLMNANGPFLGKSVQDA